MTGRKSEAPFLAGGSRPWAQSSGTPGRDPGQPPFTWGCDPGSSLRGGWLKSALEKGSRKPQACALDSGSRQPLDFSQTGTPEVPALSRESEHSRTGEGRRRGKWQGGIGKAAGGVEICRWRDVRVCECLEKGKTRSPGNAGGWGVASRTTVEDMA